MDVRQPIASSLLIKVWIEYALALAVIPMPCQIVRGGGRLIFRLLSWNPWQGVFLRLVERLHGCWLC